MRIPSSPVSFLPARRSLTAELKSNDGFLSVKSDLLFGKFSMCQYPLGLVQLYYTEID
ncbi:MAG: hypothetical protein ACYCS0_00950 [bacterium]